MPPPSSPVVRNGPAGYLSWPYWYWLLGVTTVAALVRVAFFTGFFGSDEVVYASVAVKIANGEWGRSNYSGSLRYGFNLPNALFIKVFGASEFSANLWSFLCSLGEVVLVYVFAHRLWGLRAALLAAAVIGLLPLHVNHGGRLLADAPLAFFITLSFYVFWIAERRQHAAWYFYAGLAAGFVFWIKGILVVYSVLFAIYALVYRTWNFKWLWAVFGGALVIGANCLLMWVVQGDPLHYFRLVLPGTERYVYEFVVETSPWFYLRYLFADGRHTWIMAYLTAGGIFVWAREALAQRVLDRETGYVVFWALGLFGLFSFMPIWLNPLTLIAKQPNYMLIFVAPLCLLAGYFLSRLHGGWLAAALTLLVTGSLLLDALEQQAVHVFTANSKASVAFAQQHRDIPVYAMTNGYRAGLYAAIMHGPGNENPLRDMVQLAADLNDRNAKEPPAQGPVAYAIIDLQTINWGRNPITSLDQVPRCWNRAETLVPTGFGVGKTVLTALQATVDRFPRVLAEKISRISGPLLRPEPAYVYAIPAGCRFSL